MSVVEIVLCCIEAGLPPLVHYTTSIQSPQAFENGSIVLQRVESEIEPTTCQMGDLWFVAQQWSLGSMHPRNEIRATDMFVRETAK